MRTPLAALAAAVALLGACQFSPKGRCDRTSDCAAGQACAAEGICVMAPPGGCGSAADCAAGLACLERTCVAPGGPVCGPALPCAAAWQQCVGGQCVTPSGACGDSAACEPWQECSAAHRCVTAAGRCAASTDCAEWEVCGPDHACATGAGRCESDAECAEWQSCSAGHACTTDAGKCSSNAECAAWERCAPDTHVCANAPGACGSAADCSAWQACNASHQCVNEPGRCTASSDCAEGETCDATHACVGSSTGRLAWIRRIGFDGTQVTSAANTWAYQLACADDGDLVAGLHAEGLVDPGDGVPRTGALLVRRSASDGNVRWVKSLARVDEVEAAAAGGVVLAGSGPADLGAGEIQGVFVARLSPDGTPLWQRAAPAEPRRIDAMAVSTSGEIVVGGPTWITTAEFWLNVTKLDASGEVLWSVRPFDDAPGSLTRVAIAPGTGHVLVAVSRNQILAGSSALAFSLALLDGGSGARLWKREYGRDAAGRATVGAHPSSLHVAADGSILVAGALARDMSLGGDVLDVNYGTDPFVLKLDATGEFLWNVLFRGTVQAEFDKYARATWTADGTTFLTAAFAREFHADGQIFGRDDEELFGAFLAKVDGTGHVERVSLYPLAMLSDTDPYGYATQGMADLCNAAGAIGWLEHRHGRRVIEGVPTYSGRVVDAFMGRISP
jgi:hypothetical protein